MPIVAYEGCLMYVLLPHPYLMVSRVQVNFFEVYCTIYLILGMGYLFFMVFLFKARYSMQMRIVPYLFFANTTDDANGIELVLIWPMAKNSVIAFSISSLCFLGCLYSVEMTGLVPSSNCMMCSNPLFGGLPGGIG
jgi:hypothetical protein